uniref:Uncharacterized protein n=1 Tax=Triticum urartu TaxID=4572 RepID=A0A8R7JXQ2_TRIUA
MSSCHNELHQGERWIVYIILSKCKIIGCLRHKGNASYQLQTSRKYRQGSGHSMSCRNMAHLNR